MSNLNIMELMQAVKISENDQEVIYQYGHIVLGDHLTGQFKVSNSDLPSVTTIKLEEGFTTRANEMRIAGKIILHHQQEGVWPEKIIL